LQKHHDIALIELEDAVEFTDKIGPICLQLPTDTETFQEKLTVIGHGTTETTPSEIFFVDL
jgi:hypothetical protein